MTARAPRIPTERELSAGGLVVRKRRGDWRVCVAGRRRADGTLVWTIPKGRVEPGESMAAAALREVREETGLAARIEDALGDVTYWYVRRDPAGRPVRVAKRVRFFLMRYRHGRFADRDDEMDTVRWVRVPEAIARLEFANERDLVRLAAARLEPPGT